MKKNSCYRKNEGEHACMCALYSRATTDKREGKRKKKEAITVIVTGVGKRTLSLYSLSGDEKTSSSIR
jgi:hypothetical protein